MIAFTSYVTFVTDRSFDDCLLALKEGQGTHTWIGGFNSRLVLPRSAQKPKQTPFEIEYYRQSSRSARSTYMAQLMRGLLYHEKGQTHLVAKVKFTGSMLMWLWLSALLVLVSVGVLLYTRNVVMLGLVGMTSIPLLVLILVMWLDRFWLVRLVRKSMGV
jgi:hypothetical protein